MSTIDERDAILVAEAARRLFDRCREITSGPHIGATALLYAFARVVIFSSTSEEHATKVLAGFAKLARKIVSEQSNGWKIPDPHLASLREGIELVRSCEEEDSAEYYSEESGEEWYTSWKSIDWEKVEAKYAAAVAGIEWKEPTHGAGDADDDGDAMCWEPMYRSIAGSQDLERVPCCLPRGHKGEHRWPEREKS